MHAVVFEGSFTVSVKEVAKPIITHPDDIVKGVYFSYSVVCTAVSAHTARTICSYNDMHLREAS